MDLRRFSETDWTGVRERLERNEGGFTQEQFVAWLSLPGTEEQLMERMGENWTLGQALTIATGGAKEMRRAGRKKRGPVLAKQRKEEIAQEKAPYESGPLGNLAVAVENLESKVEARVNEYLEDFEDVTVNDRASLHDLAYAEVAMEALNKLRISELARELPNADTLKRYGESIATLSAQTRALQKTLDIERVTRNSKEKKRDAVEEVLDLIEGAGKWVEEEAIEIKIGPTLIGFLLTDFPELEHTIRIKLPEGWKSFEYYPDATAKRAIEPSWVAEEEARYATQVIGVEEDE